MALPKAILLQSRDIASAKAVDLMTYGSTIFPNSSGVLDLASSRLLGLGVEFAVAARRCFEIDGSKPEIQACRFPNELRKGSRLERNFLFALNGIIHARELRAHFCPAPYEVFANDGNVVALHFVYETDKYPETYVDIFGLAWTFLTFGPFAWDLKGQETA